MLIDQLNGSRILNLKIKKTVIEISFTYVLVAILTCLQKSTGCNKEYLAIKIID